MLKNPATSPDDAGFFLRDDPFELL